MTNPWWNAESTVNKLRLRAVRKRGTPYLQEKLAQPEFQQQLMLLLQEALHQPTRNQAVTHVQQWFQTCAEQAKGLPVWTQIWQELESLLNEPQNASASLPSVSSPSHRGGSSSYPAVGTSSDRYASATFPAASTTSTTHLSAVMAPSSPPQPKDTKSPSPSSPSLPSASASFAQPSSPSSPHSIRNHRPLPPRRTSSSSSHESLPDTHHPQAVSPTPLPAHTDLQNTQHLDRRPRETPPSTHAPNPSFTKRIADQGSQDRSHHIHRQSPSDRDTQEQRRPSSEQLQAANPTSATTTAPPSNHPRPTAPPSNHPRPTAPPSNHPRPTAPSSASNPKPVSSSANPRPSTSPSSDHRPEVLAGQKRTASSPSLPASSAYSASSGSGFWLPSTSVETQPSSNSLDDLEFAAWWDTPNVVDSLRLRLQRRQNSAQLKLLLDHKEFMDFITHSLYEAAGLATIQEAQKHVRMRLLQLQQQTPQNNWSDAFWSVLLPLLQLRHKYSGSFDAIPSSVAQQIEQNREQLQQYLESRPRPPALYDWENDNRDWILYINNVVGKIANTKDDGGTS